MVKGAIYFSGKYGSTAQYSQWISEATGLPVYNINQSHPNPADFDFLVLGSSVIVGKLTIRNWVTKHLNRPGPQPKSHTLHVLPSLNADAIQLADRLTKFTLRDEASIFSLN